MGSSELKSLKVAEKEDEELIFLKLGEMSFHKYDPRGVCKRHCDKLHFSWPYDSYSWEEEGKINNWYNVSRAHASSDEESPSNMAHEQDDF